jgi:hypothetical protein
LNYLSGGDVKVTGGGGSDFFGVTKVDIQGALTGVLILNHGHSFKVDPDTVLIYYNGTNVKMVCFALAHPLSCMIDYLLANVSAFVCVLEST